MAQAKSASPWAFECTSTTCSPRADTSTANCAMLPPTKHGCLQVAVGIVKVPLHVAGTIANKKAVEPARSNLVVEAPYLTTKSWDDPEGPDGLRLHTGGGIGDMVLSSNVHSISSDGRFVGVSVMMDEREPDLTALSSHKA